jgi:hypothetical protein
MAALPGLLKLLTGRASLPLAVAMKAAKSLMPDHATSAALSNLTAEDLVTLGLEPVVAKKVAKALGKSGPSKAPAKGKRKTGANGDDPEGEGPAAGPSTAGAGAARPPPPKKPRAKKANRDLFEIAGEQAETFSGEKPYPALDYGVDLTIGVRTSRLPLSPAASASDPLALPSAGATGARGAHQPRASDDSVGARVPSPARLQRAGGALVG